MQCERALEQAERIGDVALVAPIAWDLCNIYVIAADYRKAVEISQKAIVLIERTGTQAESFGMPVNIYAMLLSYNGYARGMSGDFGTGQDMCEKGLRIAQESGKSFDLALSETYFGLLFWVKGDGENTVRHLQKCARVYEQTQAIYAIGVVYSELAYGYYFLGDLENARKQAERAIEIYTEAGITRWLSSPHNVLGMVYLDSGDLKKAQSCIEQALNLAQKNGEKQHEGLSRVLLGRVLGKEDLSQGKKAQEYIRGGINILEERGIFPFSSQGYLYLGELYADMGQRDKALESLRKAESAFRKMGMDYWLCRTQEVLEKLQA